MQSFKSSKNINIIPWNCDTFTFLICCFSQEDELLEIDKEIQLEKTSLRELLKNEGMLDDEIDGIVAMEINSNNEEGNDWNEKVNNNNKTTNL